MTNIIRNCALVALMCTAFGLSCASAADPGVPTGPQNVPAGRSVDNSKQASVGTLTEYACKKGTPRKGERQGLVSEVMQRGADNQPVRVLGLKDSKTGKVTLVHVLDSDCSAEQPTVAEGAASLVLVHTTPGNDEYFYAISSQGECLKAFRLKYLGQFVPVDMSTRLQDCQKDLQVWFSQATRWKAQTSGTGSSKP